MILILHYLTSSLLLTLHFFFHVTTINLTSLFKSSYRTYSIDSIHDNNAQSNRGFLVFHENIVIKIPFMK
jgi:hypothetical protein